MILVYATAVAILFGVGAVLMVSRDLLRSVAGVLVASHGVTLFVLTAGRLPAVAGGPRLAGSEALPDPLVRALTLTAIVISFGIVAFLLGLLLRVRATHGSIDLQEIAREEAKEEDAIRREDEEV